MLEKWKAELVNNTAVQKIWGYIRKRKIIQQHKRVYNFWKPIIEDYVSGKLPNYSVIAKRELPPNKIIWQYWGQGEHDLNLPEVVRLSFASVDRYKGDYVVIRLDDGNIGDYIDLPTFVAAKRAANTSFNRTFFSDLLRLALLKAYGGVWLDATTLLSDVLPESYTQQDFFVYQRDQNEKNKAYWENSYAFYWSWQADFRVRMLNSFIFAKKGNKMVEMLLDLILYYWKTQERIVDYFFFQIVYDILMREYEVETCVMVSDVLPHLLQTKINNPSVDFVDYETALQATSIHKMSYYRDDALQRFSSFVHAYILTESESL
ncbi:capsular polysaccharide synthesis protein [Sphingobacterium bambusae]|uniref:Capsular polysaccharide synthesis protein n=1 Tax=Sphingobacterium bambusae TaxID=662858 RepID=A0ABW6BG58_9SPHI|nr:capsular polysaccharide synthesis protein [Sphingobacterium bambusae]WPL46978.1 capsular polysaccharide synthesis protein [Sphingobacterium bambusae]